MSLTYKIRDGIVKRRIHGDYFLINIRENYFDDKCFMYQINDIGNVIWEGLGKYQDDQIKYITMDIINLLGDKIDFSVIYKDVEEYLLELKKDGFLVEYGRA